MTAHHYVPSVRSKVARKFFGDSDRILSWACSHCGKSADRQDYPDHPQNFMDSCEDVAIKHVHSL